MTGKKYDGGKTRWDLMPFGSLEGVAKVLTHGAEKYGDENWKTLDDGVNRYFAATMRHLTAWRKGQDIDPDSGLEHLAHAACSLLFIMALKQPKKTPDWLWKEPPPKRASNGFDALSVKSRMHFYTDGDVQDDPDDKAKLGPHD